MQRKFPLMTDRTQNATVGKSASLAGLPRLPAVSFFANSVRPGATPGWRSTILAAVCPRFRARFPGNKVPLKTTQHCRSRHYWLSGVNRLLVMSRGHMPSESMADKCSEVAADATHVILQTELGNVLRCCKMLNALRVANWWILSRSRDRSGITAA